jgi:hypothetical protein
MSLVPARDAYPWRLRLVHEGLRALIFERPGRFVRVDPIGAIARDDIVVLTGAWPEQVEATAAAVRAGLRPTVIAAPELLAYLGGIGALDGFPGPVSLDGLAVELAEAVEPRAGVATRAAAAALAPGRALLRLGRGARLPRSVPRCFRLTLPDGGALVYLNTALTAEAPAAWVDAMVARWGGAEWLLVGMEPEQEAAIEQLVPRFGAKHVILTDLVSEIRRGLRLPVGLLTPAADRLVSRGVPAQVFVSGAGLRYERV